jgi:hypothetical protein
MIIVYYIFINPNKNWKEIVYGQLIDLQNEGLLLGCKLYVHICCNEIIIHECLQIINYFKSDAIIRTSSENLYEYSGIKLLYNVSKENPDEIIFYMHSKGMVFHNCIGRSPTETLILRNTIKDHKEILKIFQKIPEVNKIGLIPHEENYIISNFFWVRSNYIITLHEPIVTNDRFYYEKYISNLKCNDCYSLLANEITTFDFEKVKFYKNNLL